MNSRVDKYYENDSNTVGSRTERNTNLYREIGKTNVDGFEIKSNATVIGNNSNNIDVEKIKSILDTHYNDAPKRRTIPIEKEQEIEKNTTLPETKEYDINVILDKARESKEESYEDVRNRKLHNTQFDILNNLNIDPKDYIEDYDGDAEAANKESAEKKLQELINTININEKDIKKAQKKAENSSDKTDPLDIFTELKGTENTAILDGLQEKTEKLMEKIEKTSSLDNTFFTKSNAIKSKDFEDFKDIEDDGPSAVVKVFLGILIVGFIVGIIILVKTLI